MCGIQAHPEHPTNDDICINIRFLFKLDQIHHLILDRTTLIWSDKISKCYKEIKTKDSAFFCITLYPSFNKLWPLEINLLQLSLLLTITPNLVISPIVNFQPSFLGFRSDHRALFYREKKISQKLQTFFIINLDFYIKFV